MKKILVYSAACLLMLSFIRCKKIPYGNVVSQVSYQLYETEKGIGRGFGRRL